MQRQSDAGARAGGAELMQRQAFSSSPERHETREGAHEPHTNTPTTPHLHHHTGRQTGRQRRPGATRRMHGTRCTKPWDIKGGHTTRLPINSANLVCYTKNSGKMQERYNLPCIGGDVARRLFRMDTLLPSSEAESFSRCVVHDITSFVRWCIRCALHNLRERLQTAD